MKATIEGVRYDTDRATRICAYKSGRDESSPDWWTATLYRQQRADRYFLHGRGGFMTRFRMKQSIVPMTRAQATAWARHYRDIPLPPPTKGE